MQVINTKDIMLCLQGFIETSLRTHRSHSTILVKNRCEIALVKQLLLMRIGNDWLLTLRECECECFTDAWGCNIHTEEGHTFRIMYTDNQNTLCGLTTRLFCTFLPSRDFIDAIAPVQASTGLPFLAVDENFAE